MTNKITILILERHVLIGEALLLALNAEHLFGVELATTIEAVKDRLASEPKIDIVLMSLSPLGTLNLSEIKEVVKCAGVGRVVLLADEFHDDIIDAALTIGCKGFISKTLEFKSLESVLLLINTGQLFVPWNKISANSQMSRKITKQDKITLQFLAQGLSNKEIAWTLGVTEVTVKARLRLIFGTLNATNRAHAVAIAVSAGYITLNTSTSGPLLDVA